MDSCNKNKDITLRELILCLSPVNRQKVLNFVQENHQDCIEGIVEIDWQYKAIENEIKKYLKWR